MPFVLLQKQTEPNVRNKILYLIQAWAHAFRNEPKYKVVQDTYQIMKVEGEWESAASLSSKNLQRRPDPLPLLSLRLGHVFPEFKESDAMFAAERVRALILSPPCVSSTS